MKPPTLEDIRAKKYGAGWRIQAYDSGYCAEAVWEVANSWATQQCSRKPGHGPHKAFCKQHARRYEDTTQ